MKVSRPGPMPTRRSVNSSKRVYNQQGLRSALGYVPAADCLGETEFAAKFGFSPATLRNWEQGRVRPDAPTRVLRVSGYRQVPRKRGGRVGRHSVIAVADKAPRLGGCTGILVIRPLVPLHAVVPVAEHCSTVGISEGSYVPQLAYFFRKPLDPPPEGVGRSIVDQLHYPPVSAPVLILHGGRRRCAVNHG
jgi:hypothetical protein